MQQRECARHFAEHCSGAYLLRPPLHETASRADSGRLRLGYLSSDFQSHAVSFLLAEVVELHDRKRFETIGYSCGPDDGTAFSRRIRGAFDRFRDIRTFPSEAAARRIVEDSVDILVDLNGHTRRGRPRIFALRPAPVQVNWLGYPGTMGAERIADYIIGDPVVTPLAHAAFYSETLALMPHCYQPNDRQRRIGPPTTREAHGLPEEGFVFCSFNQGYKIAPNIFDLWGRLLAAVPGSVLWLLECNSDAARENLRSEAALRGIAPERIVFAPKLPPAEHLGRLRLADLMLDTFPYTSHTTGSDALWVGLPLVTRLGETFASRVAGSLLRAAELPELVTATFDGYFNLALGLAEHPMKLAAVKDRLAARRLVCPLFDSARFTRDLERLFERMWENHLAGRKERIVLADEPSDGRKQQ
jgi:predicted O-linked N-acetylglucosamine transferase (SPINDLY family)